MRKILIINTGSYFVNGISNVITTFLENLDTVHLSISITSYGVIDPRYKTIFDKKNVVIEPVPNRRKNLLSYYKTITSLMKREKYDVVHVHGNSGTMLLEVKAAKKAHIKNIVVQSHNSSCSMLKVFGKNSFFAKKMNKLSDRRIAVSKLVGDWIFGKDYEVINNAIEINKFLFSESKRKEIRDRYHISDNDFVIGHVGCFNKQKNQKFLIEIFEEWLKLFPNSFLIMAGEGPTSEEIKLLIAQKQLQSRVVMPGKIDNTFDYYNAFDLFVLPSLWEGLGVVNIEAQANGLPCLASSEVANEANVSDRYFVEDITDTAAKWALKIQQIKNLHINRASPMEQMIEGKGYSIKTEVSKLLKIYEG
jgi:glycosyltransferase involved in cell wall biosynthesis